MSSTYQVISLSPHTIDSTYPETNLLKIQETKEKKTKPQRKSKEKEETSVKKTDVGVASLQNLLSVTL